MAQFIKDMYSTIDNINQTPKKITKSLCQPSTDQTNIFLHLTCNEAFILKYLLQSLLIIKIDGIVKEEIIKDSLLNIKNFNNFLTKYTFIKDILDNINLILIERLIIEVNKLNETLDQNDKYNLTIRNYVNDINLIFYNPTISKGKKRQHKPSRPSTYKHNLTPEIIMIHRVYNNKFDNNIKLPDTDNEQKILNILNNIFLVVVTKIDDSLLETFTNNDLCLLKLVLIYIIDMIDNIKQKLVIGNNISIDNISIDKICINNLSITKHRETSKKTYKPDDCTKDDTNKEVKEVKEILKKITITAT